MLLIQPGLSYISKSAAEPEGEGWRLQDGEKRQEPEVWWGVKDGRLDEEDQQI